MNQFFFPLAFFNVQLLQPYSGDWEYEGVDDLSLGLSWHIFVLDIQVLIIENIL